MEAFSFTNCIAIILACSAVNEALCRVELGPLRRRGKATQAECA